ncbi:vacuolar import and degradation protein-domain-containing protein [Pilobolus umbonatus]|nr:vacuolar import and degradation protein-domain-containing protein [Pilobolus umbonatus]
MKVPTEVTDTQLCESINTTKHTKLNSRKQKSILLTTRNEDDCTVDLSEDRIQPVHVSGLYPGSVFEGTQKCGAISYDVTVEIQYVDMARSTLSGYLKIKGLTKEFPELTTYFEGEVMGEKYSFLTCKWDANQSRDTLHWRRFPSFKPYINIFTRDDFVYDYKDNDFVYMRWKEKFLVPDHRISSIHGASFAGFYYICYQRSTNQIKGFYFFRHHTFW